MKSSRAVSPSEAEALKKGAVPLQGMSPDVPDLEWFQLPDGRILMLLGMSGGRLYPADQLERLRAEAQDQEDGSPTHYSDGGELPPDFLDRIPSLVDECRRWVTGEGGSFDLTLRGLEDLDAVCARAGRRKCLQSPRFAMLVATVGEVVRQLKRGRWEIRGVRVGRSDFYEGWVVDDRGWEWDVGRIVFKSLDDGASLAVAADLAMRASPLRKKVTRREVVMRDVGASSEGGPSSRKTPPK